MPEKHRTSELTDRGSPVMRRPSADSYPPAADGREYYTYYDAVGSNPLAKKPTSPRLATRAFSFGLVGGFVALVGFVLLYALVQYGGLNKNLAYFIQAVVSIELNFFLNRSVTWRDRRGTGLRAFAVMWARFHLTRVFTVVLNQVLFGALVFIGVHYLIANALCIIIVMIINFVVGDRFIFRSRPVANSMVEVLTADLFNHELATEPQLTSILRPRAIPATGWPSVSIVVPVGRNKAGLEPTVASLLTQDYPGEIEILLVGDHDDAAWDEVRWYIDDQLVTVIEASPGTPPAPLGMKRLGGIGRAHGQILASLDAGMVVPKAWVSRGVECIRSGWPCVVGTTSVFGRVSHQSYSPQAAEAMGRVLDPERFVETDYVPPIAANMFIAGDVLPSILSSANRTGENSEDFLEWLWNLAHADIAIFETSATAATFARSLSVRRLLTQYVGAGVALARFARAALNTAALPRQRARMAGAFFAIGGVLALVIAGLVMPGWPHSLGLPARISLGRAGHSPAMPSGSLLALATALCALAIFVWSGIASVVRTGQRRAIMAPIYRLAFTCSMIVAGIGGALRLRGRVSNIRISRFKVVHSPEQAFTRPMSAIAPGPLRRRGSLASSGPKAFSAPAVEWPSVSIVIPVKGNHKTIAATIDSLLTQDYQGNVEILLVGDVNDSTWQPIRPLINAGRVRILEVNIHTSNRDANAKRTAGLQNARGEILALTDSDMVLPPHWISTGVQYILRGWPCVGGPMRGASGTFWDAYADLVSLGSKTPRFVVNRVVDDKRFGLPHHKPPITANVFMTRDALKSAGDFDPTFVHSYEDYSWFWSACKSGVPILCTPTLQADHYHRQGWGRLMRQYTRAGRGCADFIMKYPESPLSRKRLSQWLRVGALTLGAIGVVLAGIVESLDPAAIPIPSTLAKASMFALPLGALAPVALVVAASAGLLALGALNAITVRQVRAVVFPFITLVFGLAFSYGMTAELAAKMPGNTARYLVRHRTQVLTLAMYAGVLVFSAGLRLWSLSTRPGFEWDEPVYASVGAHFAQFGIVEYKAPIGRSPLYLSHPPFYFVLLGAWFHIVGSGIAEARVFSVLMSLVMLTLVFAYLHARMGRWALLPTALVGMDGWIVFANRISWIDNSVMVFGMIGVWAYYRALRNNGTRAYIFAGLALGFTLVFKQLGIYFCAIPVLNWMMSRQRTRGHVIMLESIAVCVGIYLSLMTIIYRDTFWRQTLSQVFRSSGTVTSRGVVASPGEVIAALVGQYHIFAFTVVLCVVSLLWLAVDILRSIRRKDASWLRRYSLEASWIIAGICVFIAIQIKFPNYFIYLMVPLLMYLGMRVSDVIQSLLGANVSRPRLLRAGIAAALLLALAFDVGASFQRLVLQDDNALLQVSNYVAATIPADDTVLADEPVGVMIPQQYCKLESADICPDVKWVITYTSLTQKLPSQASDPQLYALLDGAQVMHVFYGFKETITVYRVTPGGNIPPPVTVPPPTAVPTLTPSLNATPTQAPAPTATPAPVPTATPAPTATPTPEPTATPIPTTTP